MAKVRASKKGSFCVIFFPGKWLLFSNLCNCLIPGYREHSLFLTAGDLRPKTGSLDPEFARKNALLEAVRLLPLRGVCKNHGMLFLIPVS